MRSSDGNNPTIAATRQVSETSYFLVRTLNPIRMDRVARDATPNTKVTMTSWWPIGSSSDMISQGLLMKVFARQNYHHLHSGQYSPFAMVKCVGANTAYKGLSSSTAAFVSGQFRKQRETYLRLPSLWNRAVSLGRTRGATCRGETKSGSDTPGVGY